MTDDEEKRVAEYTAQLQLEAARLAREVEAKIKVELARLPPAEQKSVLERVAVDVLSAMASQAPPSEPVGARTEIIAMRRQKPNG